MSNKVRKLAGINIANLGVVLQAYITRTMMGYLLATAGQTGEGGRERGRGDRLKCLRRNLSADFRKGTFGSFQVRVTMIRSYGQELGLGLEPARLSTDSFCFLFTSS